MRRYFSPVEVTSSRASNPYKSLKPTWGNQEYYQFWDDQGNSALSAKELEKFERKLRQCFKEGDLGNFLAYHDSEHMLEQGRRALEKEFLEVINEKREAMGWGPIPLEMFRELWDAFALSLLGAE